MFLNKLSRKNLPPCRETRIRPETVRESAPACAGDGAQRAAAARVRGSGGKRHRRASLRGSGGELASPPAAAAATPGAAPAACDDTAAASLRGAAGDEHACCSVPRSTPSKPRRKQYLTSANANASALLEPSFERLTELSKANAQLRAD